LEALMWADKRVQYGSLNDDFDPFCIKGGFKKFTLAGLPKFQSDVGVWEREVQIFDAMIEKAGPSAGRSGISWEWAGHGDKVWEETAFGHRGVASWIECLSWFEDAGSKELVEEWEKESIAIASEGFKENEVETYQNFSRDTTIESRFPGKERLERLTGLKQKWDPKGVFTKVFL
jgi:hypothetical protein